VSTTKPEKKSSLFLPSEETKDPNAIDYGADIMRLSIENDRNQEMIYIVFFTYFLQFHNHIK